LHFKHKTIVKQLCQSIFLAA